MLSVNPKMLPRLDETEADLDARRLRATEESWHGEIEGIDLIIGCGCWLRREDFTSRFITAVDGND